MKALITIQGNKTPKVIEIDPQDRVGSLVKLVPEAVGNRETYQDFEVIIKNDRDDLDKGLCIADLKDEIKRNRPHFLISQCKKVALQVNYAGRVFEDTFPSAFSLIRVAKKVFDEFRIGERDAAGLFFWNGNDPIHDIQHVLLGGLTEYPDCSIKLRLGTKQDINGFKGAEEILKDHLDSEELQFHQEIGKFEIVEGATWPLLYVRVFGFENRPYVLRFNLDGYPKQAPTATFWDIEGNRVLEESRWPRYNPRCLKIFRTNWNNGRALYLPCDRICMQQHANSNWPTVYQKEKWHDGDTIMKYIDEVSDALSRIG